MRDLPTKISVVSLAANSRVRVCGTEQLLQALNLRLLLFDLFLLLRDLSLLLFDGVDHNNANAVVLHAFDLSLFIASNEQGLNRFDLFGGQTEIDLATVFPSKHDWAQAIYEFKPRGKRRHLLFVPRAGGAGRDDIAGATQRCCARYKG